MKILYEEKISRIWFWIVLILSLVIAAFFSQIPSAIFTMVIFSGFIILVAYLVVFGYSFRMHENSIIIRMFFIKYQEVFYKDIAKIEIGKLLEKYVSKYYTKQWVETESGERFNPNTFILTGPRKGIAVFMKNGEKRFFGVKDQNKVISILKRKINQ